MTTMTIRNIDDDLKKRLRLRAASHGHSMEDEVRDILKAALSFEHQPKNLVESIRARIDPLSGVDLPEPLREPIRDPAIGE